MRSMPSTAKKGTKPFNLSAMNNVWLIEVGDVPVWIGKHGHKTSPGLAFGLHRKLNTSINPLGIRLLKVTGTKQKEGRSGERKS